MEDSPKNAEATLTILSEIRDRLILSLGGQGRVREYQLRYRIAFKVHDLKGREYVAPTEIVLARDISFSDDRVLAKEQEEVLLYRDMQNDMVQQLLRRMAAAKIEG